MWQSKSPLAESQPGPRVRVGCEEGEVLQAKETADAKALRGDRVCLVAILGEWEGRVVQVLDRLVESCYT